LIGSGIGVYGVMADCEPDAAVTFGGGASLERLMGYILGGGDIRDPRASG
jgi:hypothetical protein